MKFLSYSLLVVAMTVALTLLALHDPGYLLLSYGRWTVELTLVVAVLLLVLLFFVSHGALLSGYRVKSLPRRTRLWRSKRQQGKAADCLSTGLVELAEGRWKDAEKNLLRFTDKSESPLLNYLAAARAAHAQGAYDRRDNYLKQAIQAMPTADIAVGLTQAEMQLQHGQLEQALASMEHLKRIAPKHKYVTKLLVGVYEQLHDWRKMLNHLAELRRGVYSDAQYAQLEERAYLGLLRDGAQAADASQLQALWESMPRHCQQSRQFIDIYLRRLLQLRQGHYAEPVLRQALEQHWDETLAGLYGLMEADTQAQLRQAEKWLQRHGQDANLLLSLGRLCMRLEIWGKARSYLEASINLGGGAGAHLLLARLLEQQGEQAQAAQHLRLGFHDYIREQAGEQPRDLALLAQLQDPPGRELRAQLP